MNKPRKSLDEIMEKFDESEPSTQPIVGVASPVENRTSTGGVQASISVEVDSALPSNSLAAQLANPKKKTIKIRFTLDLEKPLDDRLTKAANRLNRPKAEVARIALERLLEELEQ
jgi:hypothetical protein